MNWKNERKLVKWKNLAEFENLISTDGLIEYCIYNNNYYGVPKSEFEKLKEYHLMFNVGYSSAKEITIGLFLVSIIINTSQMLNYYFISLKSVSQKK